MFPQSVREPSTVRRASSAGSSTLAAGCSSAQACRLPSRIAVAINRNGVHVDQLGLISPHGWEAGVFNPEWGLGGGGVSTTKQSCSAVLSLAHQKPWIKAGRRGMAEFSTQLCGVELRSCTSHAGKAHEQLFRLWQFTWFGDKEPLLCWMKAELQDPLVCLSHPTDACTLLEDAEPWPPSSGRECSDRDVLSTHYYVPAACVMYCAPSKQT